MISLLIGPASWFWWLRGGTHSLGRGVGLRSTRLRPGARSDLIASLWLSLLPWTTGNVVPPSPLLKANRDDARKALARRGTPRALLLFYFQIRLYYYLTVTLGMEMEPGGGRVFPQIWPHPLATPIPLPISAVSHLAHSGGPGQARLGGGVCVCHRYVGRAGHQSHQAGALG